MNKLERLLWIYVLAITLSVFGFLSSFFVTIKANEPKPLLHFVQISDTHLQHSYAKDAERLLGSSEKLLTDAVAEINEIKDLDFVLSTGDQVDVPEEKLVDKYIEITMSLKYPFYILLGNHDVSVNGGLGKKGFIKKFYKLDDATSFTNKMTYYSFSPNEKFTVICLDGTTDKLITAHGQIDDKQLEWLKGELEANKDKYVIIALHFPLIEPYKSDTHFVLEPDRTKVLDLINSYKNVIGVFTGHYHAARLFKIKNKIHNSCPAVVQYPNAFREITITQDDPKNISVNFKWHSVDGQELRDISMNSSKSWTLTQGVSEDREQTIKLRLY
ncbi:MAG: metallophosphoesterase [Candidatus Melainabacteria bacterium]|nr:metallophosphoesterase [Candidatus Melainabacteria bacterium]